MKNILSGSYSLKLSGSYSLKRLPGRCFFSLLSPGQHWSKKIIAPGADQGQRDGLGGRGGVLQGQQRHRECGQRGERPSQHQVSGEAWSQCGLNTQWDLI